MLIENVQILSQARWHIPVIPWESGGRRIAMSSRSAWVATQVPDQPIFHLKKLIIHDIVFERKPSSIMANLVLHRFDS